MIRHYSYLNEFLSGVSGLENGPRESPVPKIELFNFFSIRRLKFYLKWKILFIWNRRIQNLLSP